MKKHDLHIDNLITKYLDKSITREECAELQEFLKKNRGNLSYFVELRDLWLYSGAIYQPSTSTQAALLSFLKRLKRAITRSKIRKAVYYTSQIAAVIVVAIILYTTAHPGNDTPHSTHTILTAAQKSRVELPDGSIVWLNTDSKLVYPEAFSPTERVVSLEGEAYFDVAKNRACPFIVKSQGQEIKVLGTSFNVRNRLDSDYAETTLVSGLISLRFDGDSTPVILSPNEQIRYSKSGRSFQKNAVLAHEHIAWATGKMTFDNDKFTDVIPYLEKKYQIQIVCPDEIADTLYLTLVVRNESKEEIFKEISRISHLKYTIHENTIYLSPP